MALTELEERLLMTVQKSQQQQTETIKDLQQQISNLAGLVESLADAYNTLSKAYNEEESES